MYLKCKCMKEKYRWRAKTDESTETFAKKKTNYVGNIQ